MSQVMVRYVVKPDRVAENEELVHAVYAGSFGPLDRRGSATQRSSWTTG